MNTNQGFLDLRLNQQDSQTDSGFWPSFTDIMTVIVMIFLLAMVILLIQKMELVNQLRSTMEAEHTAAELARTTGKEKDSISLRLHDTESELSLIRLQVMRLEEQREQQDAALSSQRHQISRVSAERDSATLRANKLQRTKIELTEKLDNSDLSISNLRTEFAQLQEHNTLTLVQLRNLQRDQEEQALALELSRSSLQQADSKLENLQDKFAHLKVKYNKLVLPARSAKGKYVVEVRYAKQKDIEKIKYKEAGQVSYQELSTPELHARLDRLKQQHPKDLYIKIVIPENSGLTYSEAYRFTTRLHNRYDYYFRNLIKQQKAAKKKAE